MIRDKFIPHVPMSGVVRIILSGVGAEGGRANAKPAVCSFGSRKTRDAVEQLNGEGQIK